ncbi:MAG: ATP-binding protein [Bacteroidales bacterium]|jgi:GTPase SAR1 family protein|nr:ATP-binding protein [Bacteroidales bacterium]
MTYPSKKLGVIVGVDGDISQVGMYNMSNDAQHIWYGEVLAGPKVGAFLTVNQNDIKIITSVSSEKVFDQQNTLRSLEFDNRFHKDSINRIITLKTKGVIEDGKFQVTSRYVPMIGNEITLTTKEELEIIYGIEDGEAKIYIGKSILEEQPINIPINKFFASHIGIFGNTGSGKSNTLHKLYLQLFRTNYYPDPITSISQFYVIDFNGEYTGIGMFGIDENDKVIYEIATNKENSDKIPIKKEYLFNADILAILFDARPATQVPFLRRSINIWNEKNFDGNGIAKFVVGTIKKILTSGDAASSDAKDNWITVANSFISNDSLFDELKSLEYHSQRKAYMYMRDGQTQYINDKSDMSLEDLEYLRFSEITDELSKTFEQSNEIRKLKMHLEFQKVHQTSWKSTNIEYLNPLFNRIDTAFSSLEKVVKIVDDICDNYKTLNIISLVHANQEITRLIPMLLSKMIYDEHKKIVAGKDVTKTKHLIIDEAHNILNAEYRNNGDDWQDYRLSVFEEIIKEGRKFGFFLTLSSQRPADISPTILSQIHNYFIHRLVNDKDLRMLENTMPTLDKSSYQMIPCLGQGEAIITGNAIPVPVFVKVEKEQVNRPSSDDVNLTDLWDKIILE